MVDITSDAEITRKIERFNQIGSRAVRQAQEESRRMGVPNVYAIDGTLYWELSNGELSQTDPYQQ